MRLRRFGNMKQSTQSFETGISQFGTKINGTDKDTVSAFKAHLKTLPEDERNLFTMTRIATLKTKVSTDSGIFTHLTREGI